MNWQNLTVEQYQALYPVIEDQTLDDFERDARIVSILFNLTDRQVEALPLTEFKKLRAQSLFLNTPLPKQAPAKYLRGKKGRYKITYDVAQVRIGRTAEIKTFLQQDKTTIKSLHRLIASMVQPYKRVLGVWVKDTYDAGKHEAYAEDLQGAKFLDVYNACVFFYHLYQLWTHASRDYLVGQMIQTGKTRTEAETLHRDLCGILDGFITLHSLPTITESLWKRCGISRPLKPTTV
jgi:hypothetical protein